MRRLRYISHRFGVPIMGSTEGLVSAESGNFRFVVPPVATGWQMGDVIVGYGSGGTGDNLSPMVITRLEGGSSNSHPQVWARKLLRNGSTYQSDGEEFLIHDPIHILCNAKVGDYVFAVFREGRTEAIRRSEEHE